ncbi:MAG: transglutaminase domain-containing protein, partial [Gemmatimonadales bacterium]
MRPYAQALLLAALLASVTVPGTGQASARIDASMLPACWSLESTYEADPASLAGFSRRFDAGLEAIFNYKIDAGGIPLQVNIVVCTSPNEARTVYDFFKTARGANSQKYALDDNAVYEFLCDNYGVSAKAKDMLGIRPTYWRTIELRTGVAPLSKSDDTAWNALYNAIIGEGNVSELAGRFEFSDVLVLGNQRAEDGAPSYQFSETPASREERGDIVAFTFEDLPRTQGIPRLAVTATVNVRSFTSYRPPEPVKVYDLTRPTPAWPTDHPLVKKALEGVDPEWPEAKKIEEIHRRVFETIRFGGDVTGSRYGTATVLEQGYGHCWDKADVFVTLCRAAGVAAREIMGWLCVEETGHVWAQAWDSERGW